jgi:hypothetical protein
MRFQTGEKVICTNDSFSAECQRYMPCWIKKGVVYTIRGVHVDPAIEGYGVYLEEVINPEQIWSNDEPREWSFDHRRFRLQSLLRPATKAFADALHGG